MEKILWVKFGWSAYYRGGPVNGNFGWLNENTQNGSEKTGHEAYNFLPASDGVYYIYVPPQSGTSAPSNCDPYGWTVVCLAKNPKHPGVHVVGWLENATLIGEWLPLPENRLTTPSGDNRPGYDWSYCIKSNIAFFVPPEFRTMPFSDTSVRQGKYSFLAGPNIKMRDSKAEARKAHVLSILKAHIEKLGEVAVKNPNAQIPLDFEQDESDPLGGFGGAPEQRKIVEKAAEAAVISHFLKLGFDFKDMTKVVCGYDFCFFKSKKEVHVEVKGTSGAAEHFYLTRNEYNAGLLADKLWALAIVTHALTKKPSVKIYTGAELRKAFEIEPLCYEANLIPKVSS